MQELSIWWTVLAFAAPTAVACAAVKNNLTLRIDIAGRRVENAELRKQLEVACGGIIHMDGKINNLRGQLSQYTERSEPTRPEGCEYDN